MSKPHVEESAEYQRFLRDLGLSEYPEPSPIAQMMRRLWLLDGKIDQAAERVDAAPDRQSRARAERKLARLEAEHSALMERVDEYAPYADVQLAVYEEAMTKPQRRAWVTPGPTGFSTVPAHTTTEEDDQ